MPSALRDPPGDAPAPEMAPLGQPARVESWRGNWILPRGWYWRDLVAGRPVSDQLSTTPHSMLHVSLRVLSGVSAKKEVDLWRSGVRSWDDLERHLVPQRSLLDDDPAQDSPLLHEVRACKTALASRDAGFLAARLDRAEHYRVAASFLEDCLFVDIETTGLSRYYDQITVIGWLLAGEYGLYVQGQSSAQFREVASRAKCVITFNGTLFDLPFIREAMPDLELPVVHVDLRFLAKRVGLTGGQKEIERSIGIGRSEDVGSVSGEFAPVLWHRYTNGDLGSLRTLLEYNLADIDGMVAIFRRVLSDLVRATHMPVSQPCIDAAFGRIAPRPESASMAVLKSLLPYPSSEEKPLRLEDIVFVDRSPRLKVVGIDLTGSEARASGWCLLDGREASTALVHTDEELVALTQRAMPHVVSIDSPLNLPEGRTTVDDSDPGRDEFGIMRYCERVLKKRGVNVYPALLPSMQRLTARGIRLASRLRTLGLPVIESYPGAAQDIMRIPRKRRGLEYLEQGLAAFGISGAYVKGGVSHDELDAITSAAVGVFFWSSMMERLGPDPLGDEALIIPDLRVDALAARSRLVVGLSGALGAGKTTTARYLEGLGFHYCRYSEVIERLVAEKTAAYSRTDLQTEGERVHRVLGQRWLGRELIRPHLGRQFLVIDGLRFPEDHAFLTEIFASQFLHINLLAPREIRRRRFGEREGSAEAFDKQERHAVESQFDTLRALAREIISNRGSKDTLFRSIDTIVQRDWKE